MATERYAELLLEWNRSLNLTGARTAEDVRRHVQDAERLLDLDWSAVTRVIDIGSGGGLPAIPLALALPGIRFALLEASSRKSAFLEHTAGSLSLGNVEVLTGRAEIYGHLPAYREAFDRAISRAAARPPVLLELALPFVRTGGDLIAEVGEIDPTALESSSRLLGGGSPRIQAAHGGNLLVVAKLGPTPATYPRRPGTPNRRPLS
jgi:16S rRNA (guanine527-N7)-methyltransferase